MKAPLSYYGGKQLMLKHILPLVPPHNLYTEAFAGGAAVLFAIPPCEAEIVNDLNRELINFYMVAKSQYAELKQMIDKTLHSRDLHVHALHINKLPDFFTSVERAWALWILSKTSFASKLDGAFGYDLEGGVPEKLNNAKKEFTATLCERLENVTIENRDALKVIESYDKKEAFHFVDPPYVGSNCGHYQNMFNEDDLKQLLELLVTVKGKFMLTMFPDPMIERFAIDNNWNINRITRIVTASRVNRRRQEEWLVCNYTVQAKLSLF